MSELLNGIFECLDINSSTGLASEDSLRSMSPFQRLFYTQAHEKIGIDAVYFLRDINGVAKIPLIYFSVIQKYNAKEVAELHRLSWNLGEAPLLFVVTPDEILIYNNYEAPRSIEDGSLDPTAGIIETLSLTSGLASQRLALQKYHRSLLESGEYWRQSATRFDAQGRVDATLMSNLRIMRKTLINQISKRCDKSKEIITSVVRSLLCRSIFIKYLEERKDSSGETVFPQGFYSNFLESAERYTDVLNSKSATYSLFNTLKEKFNGDTLQVSEIEIEIISQNDLDELRTFILGDSELESKQLALWPFYSFDIIPIQLISSIYELFFHLSDEEDEKGTYYTPLHLVNLVMDEVYPWEGEYKDTSFFDPSCGSGIFLVEAYRRLVCRWMSQNDVHSITCDQLNLLLKSSIFSVDINEEAIRVASFSLSLHNGILLNVEIDLLFVVEALRIGIVGSDIWNALIFFGKLRNLYLRICIQSASMLKIRPCAIPAARIPRRDKAADHWLLWKTVYVIVYHAFSIHIFHPFRPVVDTPSVRNRCIVANITKIGTSDSVAIANIAP